MKHIYSLITILTLLSTLLSAQDAIENKNSESALASESKTTQEQNIQPSDSATIDSEDNIIVEASIFDERNILSEKQIAKIQAVQDKFDTDHKCKVSYGLYDANIPSFAVHQKWKDMVAKDKNQQFHLFLNIGVFSKSHILDIYYRYPPALKNMGEIDTVLANLRRDLQSETSLEDLLERSYDSVNDELAYLGKKPEYESSVQEKANAFEAAELKKYLFKILKIAAFVLVPLIALLLLWAIFSAIRNSRPYHFPNVEHIERFGAKYSATSIAKIKK